MLVIHSDSLVSQTSTSIFYSRFFCFVVVLVVVVVVLGGNYKLMIQCSGVDRKAYVFMQTHN